MLPCCRWPDKRRAATITVQRPFFVTDRREPQSSPTGHSRPDDAAVVSNLAAPSPDYRNDYWLRRSSNPIRACNRDRPNCHLSPKSEPFYSSAPATPSGQVGCAGRWAWRCKGKASIHLRPEQRRGTRTSSSPGWHSRVKEVAHFSMRADTQCLHSSQHSMGHRGIPSSPPQRSTVEPSARSQMSHFFFFQAMKPLVSGEER
jgi:hypothetical protein